jgi:cobalt-zinc-cadmium efflux system membrane fusion protein
VRRLLCSFVGLSCIIASAVLAHGGEDHSAPGAKPSAGPTPGAPIFLSKDAQFLLDVRTATSALQPIQRRLVVAGHVVPRTDRQAMVFAPVAGRIRTAPGSPLPRVGQHVTRGQVLAELVQTLTAADSAQLGGERIRAESASGQARVAVDLARKNVQRMQSLGGVVAAKEVQRAQAELQTAQQDLERSQRERSLLSGAGSAGGGRITTLPLVSPLDGVLVQAHATEGEQAEPGKKLFTVVDSSVVWVEAHVFSQDVALAAAATDAQVQVDAFADTWFAARLLSIGQTVDDQARTLEVLFEVDNADGRLRPGMFATVAVGLEAPTERLSVPTSAILQIEGRSVVFVHTAPETFVQREVVLGPRDGPLQAIERGLEDDERVVVQGTYYLRWSAGGR